MCNQGGLKSDVPDKLITYEVCMAVCSRDCQKFGTFQRSRETTSSAWRRAARTVWHCRSSLKS